MKKIFILFISLTFIGVIYLAIEGRKIQEIKTEIEISAPPSKVWSIIKDINNWHQWSPIINASNGEASIGSKLSITMMGKEKGQDGPQYNPIIKELNEPNYFRWRAHMLAGFIFTNDKIFELEETKSGTRLTHTETFKGILTPIFFGQVKKAVPPMLNSMNKALKELAEKKIAQ
ncbi:MAG: SRPBCC domain-containing protein [Gammaproteobacteria bacterium]|nr:SRPBCC domain-containing protein [Gammaproteobacteria bacterium]